MTYVISKTFGFTAAHHLDGLPEGHKCARPHGHTYSVEIRMAAQRLDPAGFVCDFADMDVLGRYLDDRLDHRDLNEVLPFQPSSERLAEHLFRWCEENLPRGHLLVAVRISESPRTWAEYVPGGDV